MNSKNIYKNKYFNKKKCFNIYIINYKIYIKIILNI